LCDIDQNIKIKGEVVDTAITSAVVFLKYWENLFVSRKNCWILEAWLFHLAWKMVSSLRARSLDLFEEEPFVQILYIRVVRLVKPHILLTCYCCNQREIRKTEKRKKLYSY